MHRPSAVFPSLSRGASCAFRHFPTRIVVRLHRERHRCALPTSRPASPPVCSVSNTSGIVSRGTTEGHAVHRPMTRPFPLWSLLFCAGALLASACGRPEGDGAAPEEAEEKTAQVTVWGDRFEIFLEHRLLVVGVPTTFVTHVTDLLTLEPRRDGPVTFVLRHGTEAPIEQVSPAPARDGIYLPDIPFPQPGEWLVSLRIPLEGKESVVSLPPFTVFSPLKRRKTPQSRLLLTASAFSRSSNGKSSHRPPRSEDGRLSSGCGWLVWSSSALGTPRR